MKLAKMLAWDPEGAADMAVRGRVQKVLLQPIDSTQANESKTKRQTLEALDKDEWVRTIPPLRGLPALGPFLPVLH